MSRRSEQLIDLSREFCQMHDEWVKDPNRPNPDEIYWDAVDGLLESFAGGDIPAECRELADAVGVFSQHVAAFDARENVNQLYPSDGFWDARQRIENLIEKAEEAPLKPLETIKELVDQKVSHEQIAKIYGFKDRKGNLMPHLVQKEIDSPGSVLKVKDGIDGRPWVDPRLAERQAKDSAGERHHDALTAKRKRAKEESKPCPETPRQLWEQNVSVAQSAKMLKKPEAEVAELFAEFDLEREQTQKDEEKRKAKELVGGKA